jgi:hypothetical protein
MWNGRPGGDVLIPGQWGKFVVDRFSGSSDVMIPGDCPEKAACFDMRAIFKRLKPLTTNSS